MREIPRDGVPDSTLSFASDGYLFITKRCASLGTDLFRSRLMLQQTICMRGEESARLFYDNERFERSGVAPLRLQETLFGRGGVQGLDGTSHRCRKGMFLDLMSPDRIAALAELSVAQWHRYAANWERRDQVVLFDDACESLCRAICAWAGIPLSESEVRSRTDDLVAMIDAGAAIGPRHWHGRWARNRAEHWIERLVEDVRTHRLTLNDDCALNAISWHRDLSGELLDKRTAAVELINVVRPTVAVAWYIMFAAMALHRDPQCRERLLAGEEHYLDYFVEEVRRFYPFFPVVAARTRREFEWKGYRFPKGERGLLDLYGTNHDPRLWDEPDTFMPERFRQWKRSPFSFIPQGGGEYLDGHRCPGEWITVELMKVAVVFLSTSVRYRVPTQDLRISLSRIPALPPSRFVISDVKLIA
jgi:fatty-acid peroxygenase